MAPELGEGLFSLLTIAAMTAVFLCPGKSQTIAKRTTKIVVVCNKDERVVEGKNKYMFESDGVDIGPEAPSPTSFKEKKCDETKISPQKSFTQFFTQLPAGSISLPPVASSWFGFHQKGLPGNHHKRGKEGANDDGKKDFLFADFSIHSFPPV